MVLACRDEQKGEDAVQRIKRIHPNSLVQYMQVNIEDFIFNVLVFGLFSVIVVLAKPHPLLRQGIIKLRYKTRMHSSRMRTVRNSGRLPGVGVCPVSVCLGERGGVLPKQTPTPPCEQNHRQV